jgi:hypothetical protein
MPRWGEKAEYPPPEGGGFERPCTLPTPEGGGIQGVHATGFSRWWLTSCDFMHAFPPLSDKTGWFKVVSPG